MASLRSVVLVTPIMPSDRHNGLAMRAGMFLDALATVATVDVVVVPVAGSVGTDDWARGRARTVVALPSIETIPNLARADVVLTLRSYMVPFGLEVAKRVDATRTVVDLDDDDERLMLELGHPGRAAQAAAIVRTHLVDVDAVTLASPDDARAIADRHHLREVVAVPNAVSPATATVPPGASRLLYVGNLTYAPNVDAVRRLVTEVLPSLPGVSIDIVGHYDDALADLIDADAVTFAGAVPDVAQWYARADAVVVPLRSASGTRIKVLEAFAHRRPVIGTPAAVSGLDVRDGHDVVIADSSEALALATADVLRRQSYAAELVEHAFLTLVDKYCPEAVAPIIRETVLG